MSDILNLINDAIFVSLVNTTLQITLLIPLIALIIWMFRIKSATTRYSLWLFVIFAIIALPLLTPFIPQMDFARSHGQGTAGDRPDKLVQKGVGDDASDLSKEGDLAPSMGAAKAAVSEEADVSLINPVSIAYFVWCAGAVFMLCITIGAYRKLKKLKTSSPDVEDPAASEVLYRLRQKIGVGKPVALKASSEIYTPISLGIFSPAIMLPNGVVDGGSSGELEMILTHELAHIKRCDYLANLLQNILKAIFLFHPLYHLMNRNLAREREHICDDWVIDVTQQRSGYAECIVGLLEKALYKPVSVPVTLAMAERKRDIPGRIDMIVDKKRKTTTKVSTKALIAVFLIGCLALPVIGGIGLVRFAGARPASDEGRIVFTKHQEGIWAINADGTNEREIIPYGMEPTWSPDGKRIAFSHFAADEPEIECIYIMNADGSNIKKITENAEPGIYDSYPAWSPDGKKIAFTRGVWRENEVVSGAIYVMDSDGANLKKLAEKKGQLLYENPDWSSDGTKIAFFQHHLNSPNQVWVMDADGGNQKMLYKWGQHPAWSPDGKSVVFSSLEAGFNLGWTYDIYVVDSDGANVEIVTKPGPKSEDHPTWSADGEKIAFVSDRDGDWDIYVMNRDGSGVQRVTNSPASERNPDWTAFSYAVEPAGKLKTTWGKIKRGLSGE